MSKPWFAAKRFGYGAGFPIAWEGWAVWAGYLALMLSGAMIIEYGQSPYRWFIAIPMVFATIALIIVAKRRTRGGWRWRSGGD